MKCYSVALLAILFVVEKDGPIVPIKKEILLSIMGDYPKLLKLIEKDKYLKAIKTYNAMPYSSLKK